MCYSKCTYLIPHLNAYCVMKAINCKKCKINKNKNKTLCKLSFVVHYNRERIFPSPNSNINKSISLSA